jgi:histidine triad (HIT) family protein
VISSAGCEFCDLIRDGPADPWVADGSLYVAFLDHRPLFPGHTLVVPRQHCDTLLELPAASVAPLFEAVRLIARAVQAATGAEGTFVAINNRVSQSVPHLHIHVVPRSAKDGLRGFFWPRRRYRDEQERAKTAARIRDEVGRLKAAGA